MTAAPAQPRVLAIIAARGGSKGLPRKNVLEAGGKPLIAWTIEAARRARCVSRVILSSDDEEIIQTALDWGCEVPFRRPAELATDVASSLDVVMHALAQAGGSDVVMLLQPTSPLRTSDDIDAAFQQMQDQEAMSCVSVCPVEESPYWMYRLDGQSGLSRLLPQEGGTRRQDLAPVYILNGAIYIARTSYFLQHQRFVGEGCVGYVMPRHRSLDIDSAEDLARFRASLGGG